MAKNYKKYLEYLDRQRMNEINRRYLELEGVKVFAEDTSRLIFRKWLYSNYDIEKLSSCKRCGAIGETLQVELQNKEVDVCFHCFTDLILNSSLIKNDEDIEIE